MIDRRQWLSASTALATCGALPGELAVAATEARKANTLRVAFNTAETAFDPPTIGDVNSSMVASSIFEAPLT